QNSEFGPIYDAMQERNVKAYEAGDVSAAAQMYDEHGVVVDKSNGKSYYGTEQIKEMIEGFIKIGKIEFKTPRKVIHDVGGDKFYVDVDFETTVIASGVVMKGSFTQLFEKRGDGYKCVYECFTMQM
ncbi:hypothetical protein PFISCL1PPCAC_17898, partial [Pristionchus fissidentatus]